MQLIFQTHCRKNGLSRVSGNRFFSLNFHDRSDRAIGRQTRGLRWTNIINVPAEWLLRRLERRPLSSEILATDIYPVHYLFIPAGVRPRFPLLIPSLSSSSLPSRRRRERISEARAPDGYASPAAENFRAAFPVIGKRRAGERPALIMRLESAGSGSRGGSAPSTPGKRFPVVYYPP